MHQGRKQTDQERVDGIQLQAQSGVCIFNVFSSVGDPPALFIGFVVEFATSAITRGKLHVIPGFCSL